MRREQTAHRKPGFRLPPTASRRELLRNGSDYDLRRLLYGVTALAQRIETFRSRFARRLGITTPQFNILLHIAEHQGGRGLTVNEVAKSLLVSGAHVTAEANRLEAKGLVSRSPNPSDGRSVLLMLTPEGESRTSNLAPVLRRVNDRLFGSLDAREFDAACRLVAKMLEDAEQTVRELPVLVPDARDGA